MNHYLCPSLFLPLTLLVVLPLPPHLVVMVSLCDASLVVENENLKKEVTKLTHTLAKAYGGEDRLLMCLGSQRASLYKEGLGYTPKKGMAAFAPHKTSFVKNNGRFCTSCKQVGHKENECKNKSKRANVSSIKINSFNVLTKGTNGVKVKFIGAPWMGSKKKPFGYQRA